jgi:hypothetical protein
MVFIDLVGESQLIQKIYLPRTIQWYFLKLVLNMNVTNKVKKNEQLQLWSSPVTVRGGVMHPTPFQMFFNGLVQPSTLPINFQYGAFDADGAVTIPIKTTYSGYGPTYNSTTPDSQFRLRIIIINGIMWEVPYHKNENGFYHEEPVELRA